VSLIDEHVEVYRKPTGGTYQEESVFRGDAEIRPLVLPSAVLHLNRLFGD
jgi:Uma2 family endonuclease